jgi:hypothetical protein
MFNSRVIALRNAGCLPGYVIVSRTRMMLSIVADIIVSTINNGYYTGAVINSNQILPFAVFVILA